MNCDDLQNVLAGGKPLSSQANEHIRQCPACGSMMAALRTPEEMPDAKRLEQLAAQLAAAAQPVRPLPSDGMMVLIALALFAAFTFLATLPFGFQGFQHLRPLQKTWYYAIVLLLAVLFSSATVKEMIPGSRKRVHPLLLASGSLLLLAATVTALFPQFDLNRFTQLGIPCLRLALACAAVSGLLASWFFRKGYATSPVQGSLMVGVFAGLSGVAVLALHCPVQNASHILVWHLGAMLISGLAGAGLGNWLYGPSKL